jgi:hypothetical protein
VDAIARCHCLHNQFPTQHPLRYSRAPDGSHKVSLNTVSVATNYELIANCIMEPCAVRSKFVDLTGFNRDTLATRPVVFRRLKLQCQKIVLGSYWHARTGTLSQSSAPCLLKLLPSASLRHELNRRMSELSGESEPAVTIARRTVAQVQSAVTWASRCGWSQSLVPVKYHHIGKHTHMHTSSDKYSLLAAPHYELQPIAPAPDQPNIR